jgi:cysteine desulfurase / selenocysteine lyase
MMKTIDQIREEFPILATKVYNKPLVYLDNAATTQKPQQVLDALLNYYTTYNSNIHRGVHYLSQRATEAYEAAREAARAFINAASLSEVVFTRGTTEAINLVAHSFGNRFVQSGDEILLSAMEHHSNIVPWQFLCERKGCQLKVINVLPDGSLDMDDFRRKLNQKTRIVAITHVSNALGTINPIKEIIEAAHQAGAKVLVDGAQATAHMKVDVQALDVDFYCISGHKMYGPTGIGLLYGKETLLDEMPPYQGGGDMIHRVSFEKTTYAKLPLKFEAGTQNIADAIGLHSAINYLTDLGWESIHLREKELLDYGHNALGAIEGLTIYGTSAHKAGVISFLFDGIHPYDAGTIIDKFGIAVRTGHHCTQPLMEHLQISGTVRASFGIYNTTEEIDRLVEAIHKVKVMFA